MVIYLINLKAPVFKNGGVGRLRRPPAPGAGTAGPGGPGRQPRGFKDKPRGLCPLLRSGIATHPKKEPQNWVKTKYYYLVDTALFSSAAKSIKVFSTIPTAGTIIKNQPK